MTSKGTHSSKEVSMPHRRLHSSSSRNQALKRLFALQEFSLANYASQAQLYAGGGEREYLATIVEIAKHQASRAAEIGNLLSTRRVFLQSKGFPMCFTGLNYLSAAHVASRMLVKQPELIAAIRECIEKLHGDHEGQSLARCSLAGEEKNLRQLKRVLGETFDASANTKVAA
jgi:hypothetical protein